MDPDSASVPPPAPTGADAHGGRSLNTALRGLLIAIGTAALVLGVVGVFLPVLPTTPFLLVAAACYARASSRLYGWLLGQRMLGPIVAEWRRSRSLPAGVKARALATIAATFTLSVFLVEPLPLRFVLVVVGVVLGVFLYRLPTAAAASD
jgi:uncharacterized membrane protein YbaN (DUF454 family)